jgi:hypothetical protein
MTEVLVVFCMGIGLMAFQPVSHPEAGTYAGYRESGFRGSSGLIIERLVSL